MIKWQEIDLAEARTDIRVAGAGCIVGAYTIGATVTPVLKLVDNDNTAYRISISIVLRQKFREVFLTNASGVGLLLVGISNDPCDAIALSGGSADPNAAGFFNAYWGPHQALTVNDPAADHWMTPNGIFITPGFFQPFAGGAGLLPLINVRNVPCFQTRPNGGLSGVRYGLGNIPWIRQRNNGGAGGATFNPFPDLFAQSWTFSFLFRKDQNVWTKTVTQGYYFIPAGAALPGMPSGNTACFGITPNGVGAWTFVVRTLTGAALAIAAPFNIPAGDGTKWNRATFQLVNADATLGRNGIVRFYVNGVQLLEFKGAEILTFPGTWDSNGGGNETGYAFVMCDEGANADNVQIAQTRVRSFAGEGTVAE